MSTDAPFIPPKKKPNVLWWIGGGFALLVFIFLLQLFGPNPPIVVSPQTTRITSPLRPDGLPDYERYLLEKSRAGVTPENNAAVLIFQALWPANLEPDQYGLVAAELGLEEIPSADSALQPLRSDLVRKRVLEMLPQSDSADGEPDVDGIIGRAMNHSWTGQTLPPLADWIDANQKPLDMIVEASRRPRFYSPSPTLLNGQHDPMISVLLPGAQSLRDAARGLGTRAMRHIGENRLADAWIDVMAIHRLALLATQGSTLMEQLVAMALRGIACQATVAILSSEQLTNQLARQIQRDLDGLPPSDNVRPCLDGLERINALDSVVYSSMYGFGALSSSGNDSQSRSPVNKSAVDWNVVLQRMNYWHDRVVASMEQPRGEARKQAYANFEADLSAEGQRTRDPKEVVFAFVSRKQRSELIGAILANLMLPATEAATLAEDRTNSMLTLTQLAAALAVFRSEQGSYPAKLDELVPNVIQKLPVDLYNAKPFVYNRTNDGYLLYTSGENGVDDGGSHEMYRLLSGQLLDDLDFNQAQELESQIPDKADDLSIRVPTPKWEMPKRLAPPAE